MWWSDLDLLGVAEKLAKKYKGYVEFEDIKQELTLWCLEDEHRAMKLFADTTPWWFRNRRLWTIGERYARKVKAQAVGYEIEDEFFYSPEVLKRLLPDVFDKEAVPPQGEKNEIKPGLKLSMEWETMMADVRRGLELMSHSDFELLWACHSEHGATLEGYRVTKGWDHKTALKRQRKALRRLSDLLGGQIPWAEDVNRDWVVKDASGEGVGSSEVVSGEPVPGSELVGV